MAHLRCTNIEYKELQQRYRRYGSLHSKALVFPLTKFTFAPPLQSKHPQSNSTSARDTVIPGKDQGSNLYDSTMPARALNNNKKTQEQKNKRIQIMPIRLFVQKQASAHTSECPSWQKNCSAKHSILKRNKRKDLLFFITKGSRRHRPQVRKH